MLLFLCVVPHRFRCLEYLCELIIFPHLGHTGIGYIAGEDRADIPI